MAYIIEYGRYSLHTMDFGGFKVWLERLLKAGFGLAVIAGVIAGPILIGVELGILMFTAEGQELITGSTHLLWSPFGAALLAGFVVGPFIHEVAHAIALASVYDGPIKVHVWDIANDYTDGRPSFVETPRGAILSDMTPRDRVRLALAPLAVCVPLAVSLAVYPGLGAYPSLWSAALAVALAVGTIPSFSDVCHAVDAATRGDAWCEAVEVGKERYAAVEGPSAGG